MERGGYVYILANHSNSTLYIGVTSDLRSRVFEQKNNLHPTSFTSRYRIHKLVYYEGFTSIEEAIAREKQLKAGTRSKKEDLIRKFNKTWDDLYDSIPE